MSYHAVSQLYLLISYDTIYYSNKSEYVLY